MARSLFTSESVSMGHPDKVADQISDAILDALLAQDPKSRVACETLCTTGQVVVAGEVTTSGYVDVIEVVRKTVAEIGYNVPGIGFDADSCGVLVALHRQSPDIAQGVDESGNHEQGAGDQGLMFGFACDDTPELMPLPIMLAHKLVAELATLRQKKKVKYLRPDAKSQVTIEYDGDRPVRIHTIVISTQHAPEAKHATIRKDMIAVATKVINAASSVKVDKKTIFHINPTGKFVVGGPHGDTGLTGRKIIVDSYGGMGRHGGGAFSGKDPSKVDRSAAYAARWVAKHIVAAKLARRCEVQVAYAIGVAKPVSVKVDTFGTSDLGNDEILGAAVQAVFDLRPKAIIESLDLLKPIYRETAYHGHFGRKQFTWEQTPRIAELKAAVAKLAK